MTGDLGVSDVALKKHRVTLAGAPIDQVEVSFLSGRLAAQAGFDDFGVAVGNSGDVTAVRTALEELANAADPTTPLPVSNDLLENLKFSECLPVDLARRAVFGRFDTEGLRQVPEERSGIYGQPSD